MPDDTIINTSGRTIQRGLAQPALTLVSRQIRSETFPIYYGNNQFHVRLKRDATLQRPENPWSDADAIFDSLASGCHQSGSSSIELVRHILVFCEYIGSYPIRMPRPPLYSVVIVLFLGVDNDSSEAENYVRIGDGDIDWKNWQAVITAFNEALDDSMRSREGGRFWDQVRRLCSMEALARILCHLVTVCPMAAAIGVSLSTTQPRRR